jgi:hypothetical protein
MPCRTLASGHSLVSTKIQDAPVQCSLKSLVILRALCLAVMAMSGLRLVLLRVHDAVLFDLWRVVAVHRRHKLEDGGWASASEALDNVCGDELVVVLPPPLGASHVISRMIYA